MQRRTFTGSFVNVYKDSAETNFPRYYSAPASLPHIGPTENLNGFTVLSLSIFNAGMDGLRPSMKSSSSSDIDYVTRHSPTLLMALLDTDLVERYDPDWATRTMEKTGWDNESNTPALAKVNLDNANTPIKYTDPNDPETELSVADNGPAMYAYNTHIANNTVSPQAYVTGHYMIHVIEKFNRDSPIFTHGLYVPPKFRLIMIDRENTGREIHNFTAQVVIH